MSGFLDTSIVVRYVADQPAGSAAQAARVIDGQQGLVLTDVVLAETAFVLLRLYRIPRQAVVDHLMALVRKANITMFRLEKDTVLEALLLCRPSGRVSILDALTWAVARSSSTPVVYSLDRRFPNDGIEVREGP